MGGVPPRQKGWYLVAEDKVGGFVVTWTAVEFTRGSGVWGEVEFKRGYRYDVI